MTDKKDKLIETVPRVNGRLTAKEAAKRLPAGRPPGAKNKTTLFKEVIREGFEKAMEKDSKKVIKAVIDKAIEGDMQAAKLLLDRILPTTKAVDLDQLENSKGLTISINVGELTGHPDRPNIEGEVIESD
jgi:hypothetical protein